MMYQLGQFLFWLALFHLLSRGVTQNLSFLMHKALRSQKLSIYALAFLLFPGTFVHELAHFLTAHLLFVPTKDLEFIPKLHGDEVKLGSVKIARTDILRRTVIGVAPLFVGLSFIFIGVWYITSVEKTQNFLYVSGIMLLIFMIGNTMFPSRKDLEGVWPLLVSFCILLSIIVLIFFLEKVSFAQVDLVFNPVKGYLDVGNMYLIYVVIMDAVFVLFLNLLKNINK